MSLSVDEYRPSRWEGSKEERMMSTLEPKYANHQIWHYQAGNCQLLEEELIFANPPHDDIKDALSCAIDFAKPPLNIFRTQKEAASTFTFHAKYGGVA